VERGGAGGHRCRQYRSWGRRGRSGREARNVVRGVRIALAAAAVAGGLVVGPRASGAPPGPHDPCARNGRDVCGTAGVGFYRRTAYGVRWFGDYRGVIPGAPGFCVDLGYWYAGRRYRYRPQPGPLRARNGELVPAARRQELAYAIWRFGRSMQPRRQAAVMLYVHSLIGGARPGELDPASLGADVASLYERIARDASRYHGPYRIVVGLPRRLLVDRRAAATVRVLSAAGVAVPGARVTLGAAGTGNAPAAVTTDGAGVAHLAVTPSTISGLRLRLRATGLASPEPHVFAATAAFARARGQRLAIPATAAVASTVVRRDVKAAPHITTRVSNQVAAVGARIHDTVTVSGLGGSRAPVHVELWGPFPRRTDVRCAGVPFWAGRFVAAGDGTTTTTPVRLTRAGYYVYRESIVLPSTGEGFVTPCGAVSETTLVRLRPTLATVASAQIVRAGARVSDRVRVRGLGESRGVVEAELYGPFASLTAVRCKEAASRWRGRIPVAGDREVRTPAVRVDRSGFYVFRERLLGTGFTAVTAPCAAAPETLLVAPGIVTGRGDVAAEALARARGDTVPVRLSIPALAIDAPIESTEIDLRHGVLGVPVDVHRLAWWRDGALPGARSGAILVAGHVDSARQGRGALSPLPRARPGELVAIAARGGRTFRYRIDSVRTYPKAQLPTSVFSRSGRARLVIVTCGGPFDAATRHYLDNIVVTASPLP